MNNDPILIFRYDPERERVFVSGTGQHDAGNPVPENRAVELRMDGGMETLFRDVAAGGVPIMRVVRQGDGEGNDRILRILCMPEYGPDGSVTSIIGVPQCEEPGNAREEQLRVLKDENEALVGEVFHRVNNNMQLVESLLRLQIGGTAGEAGSEKLSRYVDRIHTIALIEDKLYRQERFRAMDFGQFIDEYVEYMYDRFPDTAGRVTVRTEIDQKDLAIDRAVPCALIVNELVDNAYRHAFGGRRSGRINVLLRRYGAFAVLEVNDDGTGYDLAAGSVTPGLGLELVRILSEQLRGSLLFNNAPGACCTIAFRL